MLRRASAAVWGRVSRGGAWRPLRPTSVRPSRRREDVGAASFAGEQAPER